MTWSTCEIKLLDVCFLGNMIFFFKHVNYLGFQTKYLLAILTPKKICPLLWNMKPSNWTVKQSKTQENITENVSALLSIYSSLKSSEKSHKYAWNPREILHIWGRKKIPEKFWMRGYCQKTNYLWTYQSVPWPMCFLFLWLHLELWKKLSFSVHTC